MQRRLFVCSLCGVVETQLDIGALGDTQGHHLEKFCDRCPIAPKVLLLVAGSSETFYHLPFGFPFGIRRLRCQVLAEAFMVLFVQQRGLPEGIHNDLSRVPPFICTALVHVLRSSILLSIHKVRNSGR